MSQLRRLHREVTRAVAKAMTREYFESGMDKNQIDAPPKDVQRTMLRADSFGDAAEVAMVAIENFGIEEIENAPRSRLAEIRNEVIADVTTQLRKAAQKPLQELRMPDAEIAQF
jgi:hypothetical protein